MTCWCKQKGKQFGKLIAEMVAKAIGLGERDVCASRGGQTEPDVYLSEEAAKRYPFHTECKNQKKLRIPAWLKQSEGECPKNMTPTVVFKLHGNSKPYIILPFCKWLKLCEGEDDGKED